MPILAEVLDYHDELTAIRRDIHAHPELAFAEQRTAELVAARLAEFGCDVYHGLAGTGSRPVPIGSRSIGVSLQPAIPRQVAPQQRPLPLHQSPTMEHQSQSDV